DYPKVLTLWAAANSNDGTDEGRISEDSAAKNVMCIGAIFHQDTADLSDDRYELYSNGNTPSRGPSADGRQKPDMAGCFDMIYTVDERGGDGYTSLDYYDDFGGTSGATPEVAGCAVLAYEMYQENHFDNNPTNAIPYASTIKALMIADAHQYPLTGTYSATRTCQGWGTPDMENMYDLGATYHQMDEYPQALDSGDSYSRNIYSDGAYPLKITIAWTDPAAPATTDAARALINNLDLKVTSPGGVEYYGNNGLWDNLYSTSGTGANWWGSDHRDDLNNLENVFVENPQSGIWTIEVSGRVGDIAQGPQDFSLVAAGAQIPITSQGMIQLDSDMYAGEDTAMIMVMDSDLNTNTNSIQTVTINVDSDTEPAGENVLLTETGFDTAIFEGNLPLSATNGAGVLQVSDGDTVTATYNDADDGSGSATVTDTAIIDAGIASTSGLTVDWWGVTNTEDYVSAITFVRGTQVGTFTNTYVQDDSYHQIVEAISGGGGRRNIDFQYTINIDPTGTGPYTINMDAYTTGETFTATYSTNGGASWGALGTITSTSDTDTYDIWGITASPGDSVIIDITGTSISGEVVDTLYVDHLYILGGSTSDPTDHNTLNWTLSGDDGAGADDVAQYNIYRANNPGGPWDAGAYIADVPAGTDTYTDLDHGIPDGIQWWYIVRAEDILGNLDTNTNAVPEPGSIPDSAPISSASYAGATPTPNNPVTIDWDATDDIDLTQIELFYQFDGGGYASWADGSNPTGATGTADSGSWSFDFPDGAGTYDFYTRATDDMPQTETAPGTPDVTIEYIPVQTYDIDIGGAGVGDWVFVSFPIAATGDVESIFNDANWGNGDCDWDVILWYDPADLTNHWKSFNKDYGGTQTIPVSINNQMGFWVRISNTGTLMTVGDGLDPVGTTVSLVAGWNMVGYPSQTETFTAGELTANAEVDMVEHYDNGAAYDIATMPAGDAFQIGQAYWIYCNVDFNWVIP
ncbi:MAG: S8 family serine peptidase, partial [Thermoplasmata archaeon]|nr:S8 family serine peptidase [Thermoplasmata archaeon]